MRSLRALWIARRERNTGRVLTIAQQSLLHQLRQELGESEETEHLIDWLLDAWATLDVLRERFGEVRALHLFTACAPLLQTTSCLIIRAE